VRWRTDAGRAFDYFEIRNSPCDPREGAEAAMNIFEPTGLLWGVVTLLFGILIIAFPGLLRYIVGLYLIVVGLWAIIPRLHLKF
jgi:hypothetical protein